MLTDDVMRQMWPHGDTVVPGLIAGIMGAASGIFSKYGLSSDLIISQAMAQFSLECDAGTELVENLNYSAQGLMNTWPQRFDTEKAAALAHKPQDIANAVYGGRMGNIAPNDGWTYRGRGGSQITGRDAYDKLGRLLGLDLLNNPDLVNDPKHFLECAVTDFIVLCGCLPFAMNDDIEGVTYHLNGGYNGLADRKTWLARWEAALNVGGAAARGTLWVQQSLNKLGIEPALAIDGSFGPLTVAAVKAFQQVHGISADGKINPQTIAAIEQALGNG